MTEVHRIQVFSNELQLQNRDRFDQPGGYPISGSGSHNISAVTSFGNFTPMIVDERGAPEGRGSFGE